MISNKDLFDPNVMPLMQEVAQAIVEHVPPNYGAVELTIEPGSSAANINCTELVCGYLNEPGVKANGRILKGIANLVAYLTKGGDSFPGMKIAMERVPDGRWKNNFKLYEKQGAKAASKPPVPEKSPAADKKAEKKLPSKKSK
jgi:hypothetical protein